MVPELPNKFARIGAILALIGSLVWVQWPIDLSKFNFAAVILLIASFVTWVSAELAEYAGNRNSHDNAMSEDADKANFLLEIIDEKQYYILKFKAVQTHMNDDDYDGIRRLINFRDKDIFPFHNQKIQSYYEKFCTTARDFNSEFYSLYTSDGSGGSTWRPPGDRYVDDETYNKVRKKIATLDNKASTLATQWEEFIAVSRQELKGASKSVQRYDI